MGAHLREHGGNEERDEVDDHRYRHEPVQFIPQARVRANVEQEGRHERDHHFSQDQDDLGYYSYCGDSHDVARDQEERFFGGSAEAVPEYGGLDVGVFVEELHALLQAPEAALHAAQDRLGFMGRGIANQGRVRGRSNQSHTYSRMPCLLKKKN